MSIVTSADSAWARSGSRRSSRSSGRRARHPARSPPRPTGLRSPAGPGRRRSSTPAPALGSTPAPPSRPVPVQPDEEVLPASLYRGHADQHLPRSEPAIAGLDRPDRRVQLLDHPEPSHQLGHRDQPGEPGQRLVRLAHLHPRTANSSPAYSPHPIGVLPTSTVVSSQTRSLPVSWTPIAISSSRVARYSRIRVRTGQVCPGSDS